MDQTRSGIRRATIALQDRVDLTLVLAGLKRSAYISCGSSTERLVGKLGLEHKSDSSGQFVSVSQSRWIVEALSSLSFSYTASKLSNELVGLLLGYPRDAVDMYVQELGKPRHGVFQQDIMLGVHAGRPIPTFVAYLSHVPASFDFAASGTIAESSTELGLKYQTHIRSFWPRLARRVEAEFRKEIRKKSTV